MLLCSIDQTTHWPFQRAATTHHLTHAPRCTTHHTHTIHHTHSPTIRTRYTIRTHPPHCTFQEEHGNDYEVTPADVNAIKRAFEASEQM